MKAVTNCSSIIRLLDVTILMLTPRANADSRARRSGPAVTFGVCIYIAFRARDTAFKMKVLSGVAGATDFENGWKRGLMWCGDGKRIVCILLLPSKSL